MNQKMLNRIDSTLMGLGMGIEIKDMTPEEKVAWLCKYAITMYRRLDKIEDLMDKIGNLAKLD